jgi:DNA repair protein RadD
MLPTLRPHQADNLEELRVEVHAGRNPLLVAPCGYGKGVLISVIVHLAVQLNRHIIFAVHGKSLVDDMSGRVRRLGIEHGVLMGGERRQRWHPVQVASIDTLHRMIHPPQADIIIADEAHMALSPTWRKALGRYPQARIIGMTATPTRLDGKGLGKQTGGLFDSMVLGPTEQELIGMGYLVGSRVFAPPPPADMGNVKKTRGDFDVKQQASVCDTVKVIGDCVEHWRKYALGRKTVTFGVDQHHANAIAERFRLAGFNWAYVDAKTPMDERARIYRDLDDESGNLLGISSVDCVSVGWDHSIVSCLVFERKTGSLGWWKQALGRASRTHRGKDHFLVLDHVGNTAEHAPYGMFEDAVPWSLDGEAVKVGKEDDKAPPVATCKHAYRWPDGRNEPPKIVLGVQMPCYATFRAGPKECPFCGLPQVVKPRAVAVEAGELIETIGKSAAQQREERAQQREFYNSLMDKAYERNYKPVWVGLQYKSKHGYWPPKVWEVEWTSTRLNELMKQGVTA